MDTRHPSQRRFAPVLLVLLLGTAGIASAAFDILSPQQDPPAFGIVSIAPDQTLRMNVVCFEHPVLGSPASPCSGELMFHDMAGNVLARTIIYLRPGEATSLDYSFREGRLAGIDPCWIPDPTSGRALPTVEVIDSASGKVSLHVNPVTPRVSAIANGGRGR
jgi:hypothetical protein